MKKGIEKESEKILTAGEILADLNSELELYISRLNIFQKRAKFQDDFQKINFLISEEKTKLADIDEKLTAIQEQIASASVDELSTFSKQKASVLSDKAALEILINDLSGRKADIEAALSEIADAVESDIRGFLHTRRIAFEKEITFLVQNGIEPRLAAWNKFASTNHSFLDIKLHSPLVTEAVKNVMAPIRYD